MDDSGSQTLAEIREKLIAFKSNNAEIGLVVIDYLQLLDIEGFEKRHEGIEKIVSDLKETAKELNVPIILISQLPRTLEYRDDKRPILTDFEYMGDIVSPADLILFIYREEYYNPDAEKKNIAELIIAKNNNGSTGTMELFFDKTLTKFSYK